MSFGIGDKDKITRLEVPPPRIAKADANANADAKEEVVLSGSTPNLLQKVASEVRSWFEPERVATPQLESFAERLRLEGETGGERAIEALEAELARDERTLRAGGGGGDLPGVRESDAERSAAARAIEAKRERLIALRAELRDYRLEAARVRDRFQDAAVATTERALDDSAARVASERARYGVTTETVLRPPRGMNEGRIETRHHLEENEDTARLRAAAGELETARLALDDAERQHRAAVILVPQKRAGGEIDTKVVYTADYEAKGREVDRLRKAYDLLRFEIESEHPVLAAFSEERGAHALGLIARGNTDQAARVLGAMFVEKEQNIAHVRAKIESDPSAVWGFRPILEKAKDELGYERGGREDRMIEDHVAGVERRELWTKIALGTVAAGLGLASMFAAPALLASGAALEAGALTALSTGANAVLALDHLEEYRLASAAHGSDFDRARAISDEEPSLFWLAVDVVGAGLDLGAALRMFRQLAPFARAAIESDAGLAALRAEGNALRTGLGDVLVEDAIRFRTGGRAGVGELGFDIAGYSAHQIEDIRLDLLARQDVGRVQKSMAAAGVKVDRAMLEAVKRYNFDSAGLAFHHDNYAAWTRLATGRATVDDVRYIVHEIAEVEELRRIQAATGFDFMGKNVGRGQQKAWAAQFNDHYRSAHAKALEREYDFIAEEVSRATNGRVQMSRTRAAAIDPTRDEARREMFIDGVRLKDHKRLSEWSAPASQRVEIGSSAARRLGFREGYQPTLAELVAAVKAQRLNPHAHPNANAQGWIGPGQPREEAHVF